MINWITIRAEAILVITAIIVLAAHLASSLIGVLTVARMAGLSGL